MILKEARATLALALPIVGTQLAQMAIHTTDVFLLARLSSSDWHHFTGLRPFLNAYLMIVWHETVLDIHAHFQMEDARLKCSQRMVWPWA